VPFGVESVEEYLHADASPAADFEDMLAGQGATGEAAQPGGFTVVLVRSAQRVVHCGPLDGVELHRSSGPWVLRP